MVRLFATGQGQVYRSSIVNPSAVRATSPLSEFPPSSYDGASVTVSRPHQAARAFLPHPSVRTLEIRALEPGELLCPGDVVLPRVFDAQPIALVLPEASQCLLCVHLISGLYNTDISIIARG